MPTREANAAQREDAPWIGFERRSYGPRDNAWLAVWRGDPIEVRMLRVGHGSARRFGAHALGGHAVGEPVRALRGALRVRIGVGDWPSGLYAAQIRTTRGPTFAPVVVRPRRLGEHRVAVVLPTNTWQAYNFLDVDGDGIGDTWYANRENRTVDLTRPYVKNGVPPHFAGYDRGFLRWLALNRHPVDVLADDDLEEVASGDALSRLYDLVVFPGHHEYVTTHVYDLIERYHDVGGNLMFLSSNNFFWRVDHDGRRITRNGRWRDLGRPESRFLGVQYVDWNRNRYPNRPLRITGARHFPRLFAGTGLRDGDLLGNYGIEIDARTADSPRGVKVLARIQDIFGPGLTAEMTYHETNRGAKVFSAGVMNFGGSALWPAVRPFLDNIWRELVRR